MFDITKIKGFIYKNIKGNDITYHNTGEKVWAAGCYNYIFREDGGCEWIMPANEFQGFVQAGIIRAI